METGDKKKRKTKRERERKPGRERGVLAGRGGLKRALAFLLDEISMPYWMKLLKNRCAVCGHRDPGFTSCMATHLMEVHLSGGGGNAVIKPPPHPRPEMKGQPHCRSLPETSRKGGVQPSHPKTTAPECKQP